MLHVPPYEMRKIAKNGSNFSDTYESIVSSMENLEQKKDPSMLALLRRGMPSEIFLRSYLSFKSRLHRVLKTLYFLNHWHLFTNFQWRKRQKISPEQAYIRVEQLPATLREQYEETLELIHPHNIGSTTQFTYTHLLTVKRCEQSFVSFISEQDVQSDTENLKRIAYYLKSVVIALMYFGVVVTTPESRAELVNLYSFEYNAGLYSVSEEYKSLCESVHKSYMQAFAHWSYISLTNAEGKSLDSPLFHILCGLYP